MTAATAYKMENTMGHIPCSTSPVDAKIYTLSPPTAKPRPTLMDDLKHAEAHFGPLIPHNAELDPRPLKEVIATSRLMNL